MRVDTPTIVDLTQMQHDHADAAGGGLISGEGIAFPLLGPDGDAANPPYSFLGSQSMGMFGGGSNILGFSTLGVERGRINASGQWVLAMPDAVFGLNLVGGGVNAQAIQFRTDDVGDTSTIDAQSLTGAHTLAFEVDTAVVQRMSTLAGAEFFLPLNVTGAGTFSGPLTVNALNNQLLTLNTVTPGTQPRMAWDLDGVEIMRIAGGSGIGGLYGATDAHTFYVGDPPGFGGTERRFQIEDAVVTAEVPVHIKRDTSSLFQTFSRTDLVDQAWAFQVDGNGEFELRSKDDANVTVNTVFQAEHATGITRWNNPMEQAAGSALAPSYSWTSDPDIGFFFVQTGIIGWSSFGTHILSLTSNGLAAALTSTYDIGTTGTRFRHIYTDDITVTNSSGGTTFPLLAPDGSAGAPSYSFANSAGTGIYLVTTNRLGFTTNGVFAGEFTTDHFRSAYLIRTDTDGTVGTPAYSFRNETGTGMYRNGAGNLAFTVNGSFVAQFNATTLLLRNRILAPDGTVAAPAYSFEFENTLGFRRRDANFLNVEMGDPGDGQKAFAFRGLTGGSGAQFYLDGVNGDFAGSDYTILSAKFDGTFGVTVFGVEAFNISSTVNPLVAVRGVSGSGGAPGFSFSANTQTGLYYDAGGSQIGIAVHGTVPLLMNGAQLYARAGFSTTPSYSWQGDTDTGLVRPSSDRVAVYCGGVQMQLWTTTNMSLFFPLLANYGTAAAPGVAFSGDPDTGMFRVSSNQLGFATAGVHRMQMTTSDLRGIGDAVYSLGTTSSRFLNAYVVNYRNDSNFGFQIRWAGDNVWDAPSINAGNTAETSLAVTNAAMGDLVMVSVNVDMPLGLILYANITSSNLVTISLHNGHPTTAANLGNATYDIIVYRMLK